jgi:hypothetical protein
MIRISIPANITATAPRCRLLPWRRDRHLLFAARPTARAIGWTCCFTRLLRLVALEQLISIKVDTKAGSAPDFDLQQVSGK